ncbi:9936_t:CDS:2 [Paraglomus brasilianum]|uniref:9936_t:CDS:1 n=1 Tax=Paraglomus brasilianum TaxID=144538 RepID=A0A9N9D499_9GLOM|nr:9936_t:CDS:2 [Paraglomus brasilianum]
MGDTQSTIKTLRELNSDLVRQITELRKKFAEVEAENIEVKAENAKLRQDMEEYEIRFAKLEQNDKEKTDLIAKLDDIKEIKEQSLQDKGTECHRTVTNISSHIDVSQLKVENQPNEEEAITLNPMPEIEHSSIQSEESKIRGLLWNNGTYVPASSRITFPSIENHSDKETSIHYETNDSDIYQKSETRCSASPICTEPVAEQRHYYGKSLEDIEIDEFLYSKDKKRVSNMMRERNREKKLQCESPSQEAHSISQNTASITSRERKNEQGLIREMILSEEEKHVTEISLTQNSNQVSENHVSDITILSVSRSKTLLNLATLYRKACDAEKQAIKANQDEILCWYHYVIEFDNQVKDIMKNEQKQTERARKIYSLFEKIDHFTKKPDIEYTDEHDNSSDDQDESKTRSSASSELPEASVNASTGTEVSEVSDTNANDNKPQSLITALSDDEPENFSDDDEFTNDNEEDGSFCGFSDDDDEDTEFLASQTIDIYTDVSGICVPAFSRFSLEARYTTDN